MARLEREVGQPLVERQGRGIRLTEAGALLAPRAGDLLTHVERVESDLAEHRGAVAGTLTVAAFATAARGLLPGVLRDLRARHPDLGVSLDRAGAARGGPGAGPRRTSTSPSSRTGPTTCSPCPTGWPAGTCSTTRSTSRCRPTTRSPAATGVAVTELAGDDWIGWSAGQICHDWLVADAAPRTARSRGSRTRRRSTRPSSRSSPPASARP